MKRERKTERDRVRKRPRRAKIGILYFHFYYSSLFDFFPVFDFCMATMIVKPLSSLNTLSAHLSKTKGETFHLASVLKNNCGHTALCNGVSLISVPVIQWISYPACHISRFQFSSDCHLSYISYKRTILQINNPPCQRFIQAQNTYVPSLVNFF